MDCRTARLLLDFARPRCPELPADDSDALDAHLSSCADCDAVARVERETDVRIARTMQAVDVPIGLRERILDRLESKRGDRQRRRLGWAVRVSTAAAVLILAVYLGFAWFGPRPQPLDIERLHAQGFARVTSPDPRKVETWFKEDFDVTTVAPSDFNYAYFKDFGIASCQGQRVPSMYFARGDTEAHVYVVSKDQFDLNALNETEPIDSGGYHVEVRRDDPDHAFVVFFKGDSLGPLLTNDNPAQ
jgi:hypothetical protein